MTRKYFEAIARDLRDLRDEATHPIERAIAEEAITRMANVCQSFNYYFDRKRFLTACGM